MIRRFAWALAAILIFALPGTQAVAQGISQKVAVCDPAWVNRCIKPDVSGNVPVTVTSSTGTLATQVQGNSASGVADIGNPVKIGGKAVSSTGQVPVADGQRADIITDLASNLWVRPVASGATSADGVANNLGARVPQTGSTSTGLQQEVRPFLFGVTSWDRAKTIQGADGTGLGIQAFATAPVSLASGAIVPTVSAAVTGSTIFKAAAGNLYGVSITTGASAGYLLVFNSTTVPADGAVTPQICMPVAANTGIQVDTTTAGIPERFTTGIVGVFSTTGCYAKLISATAFLRAKFQ